MPVPGGVVFDSRQFLRIKQLKVKIKSLTAEAAIIRMEERKVLARRKFNIELWISLQSHRRHDVRAEQRSALLAYGFFRGRPYAVLERPSKDNPPDWPRVCQLVAKFGAFMSPKPDVLRASVEAWSRGESVVFKNHNTQVVIGAA
jgi:hypothetical protein